MPERRRRRPLRTRRLLAVAAIVAVAIAGIVLSASLHDGTRKTGSTQTTTKATAAKVVRRRGPLRLVERSLGQLAAPLQDPGYATLGRTVVLAGGLTANDTSADQVHAVTGGRDTIRGRLPSARHDAPAAALGDAVYLFGGGNGVGQLDEIVRIRGGSATAVGRLPAPSSDSAAASVGGTAYVIGGYTGTRWLDTIVAWRPGTASRVVAHLPAALRYAAAATVGRQIVIAGGSLESGSATNAVLLFDPGTGKVNRIGSLPAATTHAAATALGGLAYVLGGRGAVLGTATDRIVSIDPARGKVRIAGRLDQPLSDLAAATLRGSIVVAGGKSAAGTEAGISSIVATRAPLARVPALVNAGNVYAADRAGMLNPATRGALQRIYVPNSLSNSVDVIDPKTYKIVGHFAVGALPQHVTPSYDLKTLYVDNDVGNSLTPLDPRTAKPSGPPIPVTDPYNLYFTPDGRFAIVVAERNARLDFRDAHTMALRHSLSVPCRGVDHMDFSADGRYLLASCEFSSQMIKVDVATQRVVGTLSLRAGSMPQDVKLSPDGKVFYVADMSTGGLWKIDSRRLRTIGFLPTGRGAHGLYPSRDAKLLYATNRGEGSISVISFRTRKVVRTWRIPGGGSPDMGGVSADGKVLWISGRYNSEVYAISTVSGKLLARIPVEAGPHGLSVWPQPGRYSLGHTGILR
ncbi:MAG: hypothetical protein ACR2MU_05350 [Gaiellaceae bacterium]